MAVEARRGCGYRKVGGLYLCSGGRGVAGETWILFAHSKAVESREPLTEAERAAAERQNLLLLDDQKKSVWKPGIFKVWRPERIEKILPESKRGSKEHAELQEKGILAVFVPDDDPDHRGTVYDDEEETSAASAVPE